MGGSGSGTRKHFVAEGVPAELTDSHKLTSATRLLQRTVSLLSAYKHPVFEDLIGDIRALMPALKAAEAKQGLNGSERLARSGVKIKTAEEDDDDGD